MNPNIIVFSSGESERNGNLQRVMDDLNEFADCFCWRDLFKNAKEAEHIALLPILMKKIPTFDFAVLVCEGHDKTSVSRNGQITEVYSMRDNVLFEIGLASMALGLTRIVLITDSKVHIPDDLVGVNGLAVKQLIYKSSVSEVMEEAKSYIRATIDDYFPIVVGAAASTAMGYVQNFVFRTIKNWNGIVTDEKGREIYIPLENVRFNIFIPEDFKDENIKKSLEKVNALDKGLIETTGERRSDFRYYMEEGIMQIVDIPTTLKTSCDTAEIILNIEADEQYDEFADRRFVHKELSLFARTLHHIFNDRPLLDFLLKSNDEKLLEFVKNNIIIHRKWV